MRKPKHSQPEEVRVKMRLVAMGGVPIVVAEAEGMVYEQVSMHTLALDFVRASANNIADHMCADPLSPSDLQVAAESIIGIGKFLLAYAETEKRMEL